jgi:hypothetical protein
VKDMLGLSEVVDYREKVFVRLTKLIGLRELIGYQRKQGSLASLALSTNHRATWYFTFICKLPMASITTEYPHIFYPATARQSNVG